MIGFLACMCHVRNAPNYSSAQKCVVLAPLLPPRTATTHEATAGLRSRASHERSTIPHLDFVVEQLQPGHRRGDTILFGLLVSAENVDGGGHIVVVVLAVEAEALDRVVVVRDLQHAVLGVAALDAGLRVAGDGDALVLGSVGAGETVVPVGSLLEVARVSRFNLVQADRLKVRSSRDLDSPSGCGRGQLLVQIER